MVVKAVLGTLAERLPSDARRHLASHLPLDVRGLLEPPRRIGTHVRQPRSAAELVASLVATDAVEEPDAARVIGAVFAELKRLIPEEAAKVSAVLPGDLRSWWEAAA